ncbi:LOG family protein [Streptosporangium vulgare]|uniref:Cytokinin riboside 5'-monophosphate phosphoribohydrolase n=1 Tax=Streptosporangium vulgare TaxID=46190 RepID=A0ABV5TNL5_9ACTN
MTSTTLEPGAGVRGSGEPPEGGPGTPPAGRADTPPAGGSGGPLDICVFCGAGRSNSRAIVDTARTTGRLIGERGHHLVYGGGGSGLMGEVAWAASESGAAIRGIIPRFLYERERAIAAPVQETQLTDTLHRRKEHMLRGSDAFIALPGGYGTLDEILEVISATYLGRSAKPLVLVNTEGFWDGFVSLVETLRRYELVAHAGQPVFHCVPSPEAAVSLVERLAVPAA